MRKKFFLIVLSVAVLAIIGVGLVGFLPRGTEAADTTPPVSVNVNGQQGIWVNGSGTVTVKPDIVIVNLGVSAQSSTVADALAQASTAMNKITDVLKANGIDPKDIQTSRFNIQQIANNLKYMTPTPVPAPSLPPNTGSASGSAGSALIPATSVPTTTFSYQVDNTVTVKIRALDKVGAIIDDVAVAGGDLTRINGVNFTVEKPEQYYAQARQAAMNDAQAKAQQLAQLSGVTLGKAFYISENSYPQPIYYPASSPSPVRASTGTVLSPGQTDIVLNVQVAYNIQ